MGKSMSEPEVNPKIVITCRVLRVVPAVPSSCYVLLDCFFVLLSLCSMFYLFPIRIWNTILLMY